MRCSLVASLVGLARTLDRGITVTTFLAGGLLRFETLRRHMAENWRHFGAGQTEPELAGGLFTWERAFYGPFLRAGDRVLVVGCGRDLIPLLEQGCRAEGLEPVAQCADAARARLAARGLSAPVYTADIATATLTGRCDVVIFSWLCYGYIPQRARRTSSTTSPRPRSRPRLGRPASPSTCTNATTTAISPSSRLLTADPVVPGYSSGAP